MDSIKTVSWKDLLAAMKPRMSIKQCLIIDELLRVPGRLVSVPELIENVYDADDEPDSAYDCVVLGVMKLRRRGWNIVHQYGRGFKVERRRL